LQVRATSRRRLIVLIVAGGGIVAAALIALASRVPLSAGVLREQVIEALEARLDGEVEIGAFALDVFPRFRARGERLVVRHHGRRDVAPLFSAEAFTVEADLAGLWRRRIARVRLDGLDIQIPPGTEGDSRKGPRAGPHVAEKAEVVIDTLEAPNARLVINPRSKDKNPKVWQLHDLQVTSVSVNTVMQFQATLTNAVPPGLIQTNGSFGPWHRDDPGHTPLRGDFTFDDAKLNVFKGIGGTLSSRGTFDGSLERLDVKGDTETPDFSVDVSGHKVPLRTKYHAIVDGTNGDTILERVEGSFLNTRLTATGAVRDVPGVKGRLVKLDVTMEPARLEDALRFAVKAPRAPITGALRLQTDLEIPPGDRDIVDKLRLTGQFRIEAGRFTDAAVQKQIGELSARARGKPGGAVTTPVVSDFAGSFTLRDGVLSLRRLVFDVPGAVVDVQGRYVLRSEILDFRGTLVMDAKVSQTVTGFKSLLLKLVDPIFRREGRTVVPLTIQGTRDHPSFRIDVRRIFRRGDAP
jgi:hypothetical protein